MAEQGDDVSWQLVERVVCDWLGPSARLDELTFLSGGIVNTTLALRVRSGKRAVLKISAHRVNHAHELEAAALVQLAALGLPVPAVYATQTATLEDPHSYLLIEHISGMTLRDAKRHCTGDELDAVQVALAECTANIHGITADDYGRPGGERFIHWHTFYRSLVDPIWHEAEKAIGLPAKVRKTLARIHERLEILVAHTDVPRLCHGDLWAANILCEPDSEGRWQLRAILDPELRHGHAEAEIAYMDLFKTITPLFKEAYQRHFRLGDHYHNVRKPVYQLYGLLNQFQLHGAAYAPPVIAAAERLASIV